MPRSFNTSGPCHPARDYMLPAMARLPEVPRLVQRGKYFVVHAARQRMPARARLDPAWPVVLAFPNMETLLPVETAAHEVRSRMARGEKRLALDTISGAEPGQVIHLLEATLLEKKRFLRVELPSGDDAGMVALVTTAAQLGKVSPDGLGSQGQAPKARWSGMLEAVCDELSRRADQLILWVDQPRFEARTVTPQNELFVRQAADVKQVLLGAPFVTTILTGVKTSPGFSTIELAPLPLRDVAHTLPEGLASQLSALTNVRYASPFVLHALAALAVAGEDLHQISHDLRWHKLFEALCRQVLMEDGLRIALSRLAAFRTPFPRSLVARASPPALSERGARFVEALLVTTSKDFVQLPEPLPGMIRTQRQQGDLLWLGDDRADAHRFAAEHHGTAFEHARDSGDVSAAIRQEMEQIYHLTEAGDAGAVLGRSVWFVEQYDSLGKRLSQLALASGQQDAEDRLRRDAISAYERALDHDSEDSYAHHYIAYNLDILASDSARAEAGYRRARELRPEHVWYHARYVCFLITRGRMADARAAFQTALEAQEGSEGDAQDYTQLHGQVARLLLHSGELGFARKVLDDVPKHVRQGSSKKMWDALARLLDLLEESRDERLVFPPSLSIDRRWEGPHLVPDPRNSHIASWMPGCVVGSDRALHIRVAQRDEGGKEEFFHVHLSRRELGEMVPRGLARMPPAGTFVEIIRYRDGTRTLLVYGRDWSGIELLELPPLFPRPDRCIRRAAAAV